MKATTLPAFLKLEPASRYRLVMRHVPTGEVNETPISFNATATMTEMLLAAKRTFEPRFEVLELILSYDGTVGATVTPPPAWSPATLERIAAPTTIDAEAVRALADDLARGIVRPMSHPTTTGARRPASQEPV